MIKQFLESLTDAEIADIVALDPSEAQEHEVFVITVVQLPDGRLTLQTCSKHEHVREDLMVAAAARLVHLAAQQNNAGLEATEEMLMKMLPSFQERDPGDPI